MSPRTDTLAMSKLTTSDANLGHDPSIKILDPLRYKTTLCDKFSVGGCCPYGVRCQFAHGAAELRPKPKLTDGRRSDPAAGDASCTKSSKAARPALSWRRNETAPSKSASSSSWRRGDAAPTGTPAESVQPTSATAVPPTAAVIVAPSRKPARMLPPGLPISRWVARAIATPAQSVEKPSPSLHAQTLFAFCPVDGTPPSARASDGDELAQFAMKCLVQDAEVQAPKASKGVTFAPPPSGQISTTETDQSSRTSGCGCDRDTFGELKDCGGAHSTTPSKRSAGLFHLLPAFFRTPSLKSISSFSLERASRRSSFNATSGRSESMRSEPSVARSSSLKRLGSMLSREKRLAGSSS